MSEPSYRKHKGTGQAFVQLKGQRYYLGTHDSPVSRRLYRRVLSELKERPGEFPRSLAAKQEKAKSKGEPKYRRHASSGQAFVQIKGDRHYLGRYDSPESKKRYRTILDEMANQPETPPSLAAKVNPSTLSINELIAAYWKHAEVHYPSDNKESNTLMTLRPALRRLKNVYGHEAVDQFGPLKLKRIRKLMIAEGLAREYIKTTTNVIRRVFRWGVEEEMVPVTVYQALMAVSHLQPNRTAARETEPVQPVDPADVESVLPYLSPVVAAMVRLQGLTGMRSQNICDIRECDIDADGDVWVYTPPRHKTRHRGKSLQIALGPQAQAIIRQFLTADRRADDHLFKPAESYEWHMAQRRQQRQTPMTPSQAKRSRKKKPRSRPAERYTTRNYRQAIQRGITKARQAGVEVNRWHPHQLRHLLSTQVRKRYDLEAAQVVLGQASIKTTERYAQKNFALAVQVAREIG